MFECHIGTKRTNIKMGFILLNRRIIEEIGEKTTHKLFCYISKEELIKYFILLLVI